VPLGAIRTAVDAVAPEPVTLDVAEVTRNGFAATRVEVTVADVAMHRTWRDVRALLEAATLDAGVRTRALATFARLAEAEAVVHGSPVDDVHFHEVGALDAIVDVVGACAGLEHLALDVLVVSPVAVGGGHVGTEHGRLPVPAPAVAELLRGLPSYGGPVDLELCTPTGAALLVANATGTGGQPAMTTTAIGLGAGGHDPAGHTNALRLLVRKGHSGETLDRLLISALIEVRSCERFAVLAAASEDSELAEFYSSLFASEFGHYRIFLDLARKIASAEAVDARWQELLAEEARILSAQEAGPRIHSGFVVAT